MRIAIIGSGISGLAAAWLLRRRHEVHIFEREPRLGGHANTVTIRSGGRTLPLDTGFLVYNERTYPNLVRLLDALGVGSVPSDMSFSVSCRDSGVEYATSSLSTMLARPANALSPAFLRMVVDILRFGRAGKRMLGQAPDPTATVADLLADGGFGDRFGRHYLLPMTAAIWSAGTRDASLFPRDTLLRFFANHGLLDLADRPLWRTVSGGSRSYVDAIRASLGPNVHAGVGVAAVERGADDVLLRLDDGTSARFDHVVVATHADQALALLADPTPAERELLGVWRYSRNDTWLHADSTLMPRRRRAWASWNFLIDDGGEAAERTSLSYWLNRLQRLDDETPYLVTLNPQQEPRPETVIRRMVYRHPVYSAASVASQPELPTLDGVRRTHFCGAYQRYGFHEDGLVSAIRVAEDLGGGF